MMVLRDKSQYDYDYEEPKEKPKLRKERTHEQTQKVFNKFGFGKLRKPGETPGEGEPSAESNAESLQRMVMEDLNKEG